MVDFDKYISYGTGSFGILPFTPICIFLLVTNETTHVQSETHRTIPLYILGSVGVVFTAFLSYNSYYVRRPSY